MALPVAAPAVLCASEAIVTESQITETPPVAAWQEAEAERARAAPGAAEPVAVGEHR